MNNRYDRRDVLLSLEQINKINEQKIMIVGLGGVGGTCCECLYRSGLTNLYLVDFDCFDSSNLNRQRFSNESYIGKDKVTCAKEELLKINSLGEIETIKSKVDKDFNFPKDITFIVDAIDDVDAKIVLAKYALENNIKIVSSMGAGNRIVSNYRVCDIYETTQDALAKKMRSACRTSSIKSLKCVCPTNKAIESKIVGSIAMSVYKCGATLAEEVFREIINN